MSTKAKISKRKLDGLAREDSYSVNKEIENIQKSIEKLEDRPKAITVTIYDLPSEDYILNKPIDAILKILPDEVMAIIPDLELFGEGSNEIEAVNDLKIELLDLYDDLNNIDDNKLGKFPKAWKRTIKSLIKKNDN